MMYYNISKVFTLRLSVLGYRAICRIGFWFGSALKIYKEDKKS